MKYILTALTALTLLSPVAQASHAPTVPEHDITVKVNGLVCDFCARALEKVFGKRDDIVGIHVDLDNHEVVIDTVEGATISDEEITALITDSGYDVGDIIHAE